MSFAGLVLDGLTELLPLGETAIGAGVVRGAATGLVVVGDASEGLYDEGEDEADGEGADDDEGESGEDLDPERVVPADEEDAEGDATEKWQRGAHVVTDETIDMGHGPLLSPPRCFQLAGSDERA